MPQAIHPRTGRPVYVPGTYTAQDVISDLPGATPEFHVPIIAGGAEEGIPFNVATLKYDEEGDPSPFVFHGTSSAAKGYWGRDSDVGQAWAWAKRHGLPEAYTVCIGKLTRASILATSIGPTNEATVYAKKYGAPGGYIKIKATAGNAIEVTPLKHYSMLAANLGAAATRVYVKGNPWIKVGQTITLGDNGTAALTKTVTAVGEEVDSTGQVDYWFDIDTAVGGGGLTTALYGLVCEYDDNAVEASGTLANGQAIIDWLNDESAYLGAHKHAAFSNAVLIALVTATALKDVTVWGAAVVGTSPAPVAGDWDGFVTLMDSTLWDDFALRYQKLPQAFLVVDPSSTVQQAMRDWAGERRAAGVPISVTCGTAWGDTVIGAGNDTAPEYRAGVLNSQDVSLWAGGLDRVAAFLSLAAAVFGRRIGGGLGHNLTNDGLLYTSVEKRWDETGSGDLTTLHRAGVGTYRLATSGNSIRYVVSQGLNTLQDNDLAWNPTTEDTPLLMQRDMGDYIDKVMRAELDGSQVGADTVDPAGIATVMLRRGSQLEGRGLIKRRGFTIVRIALNDAGTGYDATWSVRLKTTNDFITLTTQILVGEAA